MTSIERNLTDIAKYTNGYVKVCATWVQTMWGLVPNMNKDTVSEFEGLNKPTEMFDNCGAYDINSEEDSPPSIRKGSTYAKW